MRHAFASGYENLSAWSDLLDRINVFPVADGDTGANLRISLAPLRDCETDKSQTLELLTRCATGNSGNIAAAFFQEFFQSEGFADLVGHAQRGREKAWAALARPQAGTILNVFDALAASLANRTDPILLYPLLCTELQEAVLATTQMLPDLRQAGVVDAGALAMYIFFEGFFRQLAGQPAALPSIPKLFAGKLAISADFQAIPNASFCVSALIQTEDRQTGADKIPTEWGDSVVVLPAESGIKVHIHTSDRQQLRSRLSSLGEIVDWSDEAMDQNDPTRFTGPEERQIVHIMTDGAGSLSREMARRHGITLLDSYILAQKQSRPESLHDPAEIYALMRQGVKVTTAQASTFERHQHYQSVCQQFGQTLYLCVGSAFTGNVDIARRWKEGNDPTNLLEIVDTGSASGRLGLIALLAARYAEHATCVEDVIAFVYKTMTDCEEYVFIDQLQYLVAGGRVTWARGFFADLLHMKPVISPVGNEVRKAGVVHSRKGQLALALEKLRQGAPGVAPVIMLQYSDNEKWVRETVEPEVRQLAPRAEILLVPLSLTSGVHMGPGTWALAWAGGQTR
ncbi:MAG: DegV family EDD domain-containing protein [Proteobacteria bacterium]|nr:DegV family EDD domain-containing protein [Pseudomonadota bacterium]MCG2744814.1 DegV family EDD domain-containing protein [Desulfobacteraceae bacterium]MBU3984815.1 DegV family EDD domain-containing protein [Pseudomonadota bacterium]MBU4029256.1 DegV family EDD domain-containing protein [Pseudomonadota bacterium]MBU4042521.1 DegV family EDD domain-containing protein [Pseudomonadota bacterium]